MRSRPVNTVANAELTRLRQLTETLKKNLDICAKDPTVDAVHDTRTGTRRIEAMLDSILRERAVEGEVESEKAVAFHEAAKEWLKLLKRIRRAAGAVRDLDVHRKLIEKQWPSKKNGGQESTPEAPVSESPDGLPMVNSIPSADGYSAPRDPVSQQAGDLDTWLKHTRQHHAQPLTKAASKWGARLDEELATFEEAMRQARRRRTTRSAALTALEEFARLSHHMQRLDEGNLHDFRKGAKKARYMAESGGDDPQAGLVGKALKKLQDEIGDWHDWLVLAEEAHQALGQAGGELTVLIEAQRDQHYAEAMRTADTMRGRLLGELQALTPKRRTRARTNQASSSQTRIS